MSKTYIVNIVLEEYDRGYCSQICCGGDQTSYEYKSREDAQQFTQKLEATAKEINMRTTTGTRALCCTKKAEDETAPPQMPSGGASITPAPDDGGASLRSYESLVERGVIEDHRGQPSPPPSFWEQLLGG